MDVFAFATFKVDASDFSLNSINEELISLLEYCQKNELKVVIFI